MLIVTSASGDSTTKLTSLTLNTGDSLLLYAAGYDVSGNWLGNFPADWASIQTSGSFNYGQSNTPQFYLRPVTPGQGRLTIFFRSMAYATGTISVQSVSIQNLPFGISIANASVIGSFPNPAFGTTTIYYYVPAPSSVKLQVVNIHGGIVSSYTDRHTTKGTYAFSWNSQNDPIGIYLVQLRVNGATNFKNILLMK
jgi:hypothetical protein